MIDVEAGAIYCNQCFDHDNGDGIAALQWLCGWTFPEAVNALAEYLGQASPRLGKAAGNGKPEIVATYDYRDERGELLYQVVRFDPKGFRQRRPKPGGGWEYSVKGTRLVLYHLREVLAADPSGNVLIVEGEKDADRAAGMGMVATTCAMGAKKWRPEYNEHFQGRKVVIVPDNDQPGRDHANQVARALCGIAGSIKLVELPGVPEKGDFSDWIDQGGTKEKLAELIEATPEWWPSPGHAQPESWPDKAKSLPNETGKVKKNLSPSQATALVELTAKQGSELWHTPEGVGFITVPMGGHAENWPIKSNALRRWLQREYFLRTKAAVNAQAIQDALGVLEGKAIFDGQLHDAHIRMAEHQGRVFIDLVDSDWRVVEIDTRGWRVLSQSPVKFRRSKAMLPLPEPAPGNIAELRHQLGLCDDSWILVVGWMLAAMWPRGPFPMLSLNAEQGAGKTTTARKIRALVDPNTAPVRSEPREPRDLMIAANNGWTIVLDNLSHIPGWLSDALCRLSTGGGFSTRELYSDAEEVIFDAKRPVIVTGIEELATRGDLLDRSLIVTLPKIPEDQRRPESEIWREFEEARPRLLGALYVAVSAALRNLPKTKVAKLPRMADFALWATAAEPAVGLKDGDFLAAYDGNRAAGHELALESSPVGKAVLDFVANTDVWTGTASELLTELERLADEKATRLKGWPQTPRTLSGTLKRLAPNPRAVGVEVESGRTKKGRYITLGRIKESSVANVTQAITPENQGDSEDRGDATVTQDPVGVTQTAPGNVADDADDTRTPPRSGGGPLDVLPKKVPATCTHDDVEESLTFDGYVNRQCRLCGRNLGCVRAQPARVQAELSPEDNAAVEEFLAS